MFFDDDVTSNTIRVDKLGLSAFAEKGRKNGQKVGNFKNKNELSCCLVELGLLLALSSFTIMVVNPYRASESILPTSIDSINPQHGFLFSCLNFVTCGLLSRRIGYYYLSLRLIIIILIISIALISYYFHLNFTHSTLISEGFPKLQRTKHVDEFHRNFPTFDNGSNNSNPVRLRGPTSEPNPPDVKGKEKEDGKDSRLIDNSEEHLQYNQNHFHRHREPIQLHLEHPPVKANEEKQDNKLPVVSTAAPTISPSHLPTLEPTIPPTQSPTISPTSKPVQEAAPKDTQSFTDQKHKIDTHVPISILTEKKADHPVEVAKKVEKFIDLIEKENNGTSLLQKIDKSKAAEVDPIYLHHFHDHPSTPEEADHEHDEQDHGINDLKQKLMERLHNKIKNKPKDSTIGVHINLNHSVAASSTENIKAPSSITPTQHPVNYEAVVLHTEHHENENKVTAFDLPSSLLSRMKNNTAAHTTEKPVHKVKIDYCKGQIDPFEKIPVDRFTPPKDAPFEAVTVWRKKMNEFMLTISKLKIGGSLLREKLANDVTELKILRFKLFCQYA